MLLGHNSPSLSSSVDAPDDNFELLTAAEEWNDDVEFLRATIHEHGRVIDNVPGAMLKSLVGCTLRNTNPVRFPNRDAIRSFFLQAIEKGVMREHGEGGDKYITIPSEGWSVAGPPLRVADQIPIALEEVPERVLEMIRRGMPFVLFAKWTRRPEDRVFPKGTFVNSCGRWAVLLFHNLTNAQRAATRQPWLRCGTLVDWRRMDTTAAERANCSLCSSSESVAFMKRAFMSDEVSSESMFCSSDCLDWATTPFTDRKLAVHFVEGLMEKLSANDDVVAAKTSVRNQLVELFPERCNSRKVATFWIEEAVKDGVIRTFKREGKKQHKLYLPKNHEYTSSVYPPVHRDVESEMQHLASLVDASGGWAFRQDLNESLALHFPTMQSPFERTQVYQKSHACERLFLQRSIHGHVVGKSLELALAGVEELKQLYSPSQRVLDSSLGEGSPGRSSSSSSENAGVEDDSSDDASSDGAFSDDVGDSDLQQLIMSQTCRVGS